VVVRRPADELHHPQPAFHPLDLGPEALGGLHVLFDGGHLGVGQRAVLRLGLLGQRQRLLAEAVVLLLQLVQLVPRHSHRRKIGVVGAAATAGFRRLQRGH
jgi:hypothetical protein